MQRVNYDKIAHLYDEPSRDHILDPNLIKYLEEHPEFDETEIRVLDIGCGTGKQLSAHRERFPRILYRYFPEARSLDFADFLPVSDFIDQLKRIGFENVRSEHTSREIREDLRSFRDYAQQRYRTSQFMALADQDYLAGLERLNHDLLAKEETEMFVYSEISLVTIKGTKL